MEGHDILLAWHCIFLLLLVIYLKIPICFVRTNDETVFGREIVDALTRHLYTCAKNIFVLKKLPHTMHSL